MARRKKDHREREVTRTIHKLFWEANFVDKFSLIACYALRFPALVMLNILVPLVIAFAIEAIVNNNFDKVPGYALQVVLWSLGYAVLWGTAGLLISRNGSIGGVHLQQKVFNNYLSKDYDFYANTFFGSLGAQASHLRDAWIGYNLITTLAIPKQLVIVVAGVIVIGYHSLLLAVVTLVAMLAVLGITIFTSTWRLKYRRKVGEANSNVAGVVGDALTQAATVKSFAAETYENQRLSPHLQKWQRMQFLSWAMATPADAGRTISAGLTMALLLVMTAQMYQAGAISIAVVALVQLYVVRLIASTQEIAEIIKGYEHAMGGAYQPVQTMLLMAQVVDKPKVLALPPTRKLPIEFNSVTFRYNDAKTRSAVSKFDLTIHPGEKIGLVGYSGSGKTTLTKLLLRFMDVSEGSIKVGGKDIRDVAQADLRRRIAYVPQEPMLFHRTVLENVAYGKPNASKAAIQRAAKAAYINEFVDELPQGYDTLVGERGVKLSGGQRQRVAIARAILKNAPILVLDEATSALDSESEVYIQEALNNLMDGQTALVIAHRLSTIQRMDKIVVMENGRIVQAGTHTGLLKERTGTYAKLWRHQSGGYIQEV